jgi:peptidyl-tRNA hydrolase
MKQLLPLALAAAFILSSCGDKSLSSKAAKAMCNCPASKELLSLTKEIAKAEDSKKMDIAAKLMEITPKIEICIKDVKAESDKLTGEAKEAFQKEFQEKMSTTCPELATALSKAN